MKNFNILSVDWKIQILGRGLGGLEGFGGEGVFEGGGGTIPRCTLWIVCNQVSKNHFPIIEINITLIKFSVAFQLLSVLSKLLIEDEAFLPQLNLQIWIIIIISIYQPTNQLLVYNLIRWNNMCF